LELVASVLRQSIPWVVSTDAGPAARRGLGLIIDHTSIPLVYELMQIGRTEM
jgi:hypothetical protein